MGEGGCSRLLSLLPPLILPFVWMVPPPFLPCIAYRVPRYRAYYGPRSVVCRQLFSFFLSFLFPFFLLFVCFYRKIFLFFSCLQKVWERGGIRRGGVGIPCSFSYSLLLLFTPLSYKTLIGYWLLVLWKKKLVVDGDMVWSGSDLIIWQLFRLYMTILLRGVRRGGPIFHVPFLCCFPPQSPLCVCFFLVYFLLRLLYHVYTIFCFIVFFCFLMSSN